MSDPSDLVAEKAAMRRQAFQRREEAFRRHGPEAGKAVAALAAMRLPFRQGLAVSAYLAMRDELDPGPLLAAAVARGATGALPTVVKKGQPLRFRRWMPGDPTRPAGFGTREPIEIAPEVEPDLLIVPLLAFDASGYRLGYGGGFYDRTLEWLRGRKAILAVGLAYAEQEVENVPHDEHDQRLDAILTPSGFRRFGAT
ncbi:MAG: 5-formyltetrahydrofolate cyclo-ligase [Hyphomicrobiaceae bacterium]|nr:MAG: 5-formyltetrahydrofolate cyclo-ligase [Hyphomicrobiaceae bacterium]